MSPSEAYGNGTHQNCILGHQRVVLAVQPCGGSTVVLPTLVHWRGRHDYCLSADEPEGAQASLNISAMFILIPWGVPADRLGCILMSPLRQSRCRWQLKCVISLFPSTPRDDAAPSFALTLALNAWRRPKSDLAGNYCLLLGFQAEQPPDLSCMRVHESERQHKEAWVKHGMEQRGG